MLLLLNIITLLKTEKKTANKIGLNNLVISLEENCANTEIISRF